MGGAYDFDPMAAILSPRSQLGRRLYIACENVPPHPKKTRASGVSQNCPKLASNPEYWI